MLSDELVDFLRTYFPVQLSEIGVALDLLICSVNEAGDSLTAKGNDLSNRKEFKDAIEFLKKASELDNISKKMQEYMDRFQLEDVALVSEDELLEGIEKEYPNYSEYEVDNTIIHTLHENFTHKRPFAFEMKGEKLHITEWKQMLIETCNILAGINPNLIARFPDNPRFNGRKSKYFTAQNPESMRSPKKLRDMDLYVETNFSSNDIRNLIIKIISHYKIQLSQYRIYLRADYTELHKKVERTENNKDEVSMHEVDKKEGQPKKAVPDFTDSCIKYVRDHLQAPLIKMSKARFTTADNKKKIVCLASSERDSGNSTYYWFGFRIKQKEFLEGAQDSYVALGCGSEDLILLIPYTNFRGWLDDMSTTGSAEKIVHWHVVVIKEQNNLMLRLKTGCPNVDISEYIIHGKIGL